MRRVYKATIGAILCIGSAHAADIASDVRAGSGGFDNSNGGYFEFGVGLNSFNCGGGCLGIRTEPIVAGAYRYRGFFFEALSPGISLNSGSVGGVTLGVNIWRNNRWALDLLGASSRWRLSRRTLSVDDADSVNSELERDLLQRNVFYNGAGVRLTGYFGNTIFQYRLVNDILGNGVTSSARIGHSRQLKNWNFHGVLRADHVSQETGQYWYGVSADEASTRFSEYEVRSSTITYSAELGATYPVRENVVFRSTARYMPLADAIVDSPLQEDGFDFRWNTSLSYVF